MQRKLKFSFPISFSSNTLSYNSCAVSLANFVFEGLSKGTLLLLGVVRYGPCTINFNLLSVSVGKNTEIVALDNGTNSQSFSISLNAKAISIERLARNTSISLEKTKYDILPFAAVLGALSLSDRACTRTQWSLIFVLDNL